MTIEQYLEARPIADVRAGKIGRVPTHLRDAHYAGAKKLGYKLVDHRLELYGVPIEEIQEAIKHGVRKINIDTDIRLAMTAACRKFLFENPDKFDAREWLKPAREAAKQLCKQRYLEFGCEGQAPKIKGETLQVVAARYAKGELAQVVN